MILRPKLLSTVITLFAGLALLAYAPNVRAESEEEKDAKEEKEAQEEAAKENAAPPGVELKGTVTLYPLNDEGQIPKVAGVLVVKSGREYLLKLTDPKNLRAKLVKVGAKEVELRGYYRNAEKYLVVTDVGEDKSVPPGPSEGL